jgi:hypothetical protein
MNVMTTIPNDNDERITTGTSHANSDQPNGDQWNKMDSEDVNDDIRGNHNDERIATSTSGANSDKINGNGNERIATGTPHADRDERNDDNNGWDATDASHNNGTPNEWNNNMFERQTVPFSDPYLQMLWDCWEKYICIVKSKGHEAPEEAINTRVPHCLRRKLNGYAKLRDRCRRTEEADAVLGSTK